MSRFIFLLAACLVAGGAHASDIASHDAALQQLLLQWSAEPGAPRVLPPQARVADPDSPKEQAVARLEWLARFVAADPGASAGPDLARFVVRDVTAGSSCAMAQPLAAGERLEHALRPGESLWIRASAATPSFLTTRGSSVDAVVERWNECRDASPVASNDDDFGLQADALFTDRDATFRVSAAAGSGTLALAVAGGIGVGGRVVRTSTGQGVAGLTVSFYLSLDSSDSWRMATLTNADGSYQAFALAQAGTYFARTGSPTTAITDALRHEAWPGTPCVVVPGNFSVFQVLRSNCPQPTPQGIVIGSSGRFDIDFSIDDGAVIEGEVRSGTANGPPVASAGVRVAQPRGDVLETVTDAVGRWRIGGMLDGSARMSFQHPRHEGQYWPGDPCAEPCNPTDATFGVPIAAGVVPVQTVMVRRPFLDISATVAGQPLGLGLLAIQPVAGGGDITTYFSNGATSIGPLQPGEYRIRVTSPNSSQGTAFGQWFDRVDCATDCGAEQPLATRVSLAAGEWRALDFPLRPWPDVTGRVTDAADGSPLAGVRIDLRGTSDVVQRTTTTDADGRYRVANVAPGSYGVVAVATEHEDQIYPAVPCERQYPVSQCAGRVLWESSLASGPLVADFALRRRAILRGRVRLDGLPVTSGAFQFTIFDSNRNRRPEGRLTWTGGGHYELHDVGAGTIYVGVEDWAITGSYPQMYLGTHCSFFVVMSVCEGPGITAIDVPDGGLVEDVDFDLHRAWAVYGIARDARDGSPVVGATISLWNASGTRVATATSRGDGRFRVNSPGDGTFRISVASQGYIDQVLGLAPCEEGSAGCGIAGGTVLEVPVEYFEPDRVQFSLSPSDAQFREGFE